MTKDEFLEWKADPRTKEIFTMIQKECYSIAEHLARVAGLSPTEDRYNAGVIRGMERILDVDYEDADD